MGTGNAHYIAASRTKRELSLHAQKRSRQRGIPADCVDLILAYGEREHDKHGAIRCLMTAKAMERVRRVVGHSQKLDELAGAYVVVSANGETVITLAYKHN